MGNNRSFNERGIRFFEPPAARNRKNGYAPEDGTLLDPWGQHYTIFIDTSGNGIIDNPYAGDEDEPDQIEAEFIIYSHGPDGVFRSIQPKGKVDDIKS